jgi:large subunit ribosomal protein L5
VSGEALDTPQGLWLAAVERSDYHHWSEPVVIAAKKAISNFKLREGRQIGVKVTLRGEKDVGIFGPPDQRRSASCA